MADYYTILRNAITDMGAITAEARSAVFARARAAMQAQIEAIDPPLSDEAVQAQWAAIDDAITRLDADLSAEAETAPRAVPDSGEPPSGDAGQTDTMIDAPVEADAPDRLPPDIAPMEPAADMSAEAETAPRAVPDSGEPPSGDAGQTEAMIDAPVEADAPDSLSPDIAPMEPAADMSAEAETAPSDDTPAPIADPASGPAPAPASGQSADSPPAAGPEPVSGSGHIPASKPEQASAPEQAGTADPYSMTVAAAGQMAAVKAATQHDARPHISASDLVAAKQTDGVRIEPRLDDDGEARDMPRPPVPQDRQGPAPRRKRRGGLYLTLVFLLIIGAGGAAAYVNWDAARALVKQYTGFDLPILRPAAPMEQTTAPADGRDGQNSTGAQQPPAGDTAGTASQVPPADTAQDNAQAQAESPPAPAQTPPPAPDSATPPAAPAMQDTSQAAGQDTGQNAGQDGAAGQQAAGTTPQDEQAPSAQPEASPSRPEAQSGPVAGDAAKDQERPEPAEPQTEAAMFAVEQTTGVEGGDVRHPGKVRWSVDGSGKDAVLSARVTIPERQSTFEMELHLNTDEGLPASHILQFMHHPASGDTDGRLINVPGVMLRASENEQGKPVRGAGAPVVPGQYMMGLKSGRNDRIYNINLIKQARWFVVPVLMESNKRALLVIAKGKSGDSALAAALAAWQDDTPLPEAATPVPGVTTLSPRPSAQAPVPPAKPN